MSGSNRWIFSGPMLPSGGCSAVYSVSCVYGICLAMDKKRPGDLDSGSFISRTLDVALDPTELDAFIDAWNVAGLETRLAVRSVEEIEVLGPRYLENLERAEMFLQRSTPASSRINAFLEPFDSFAAFIVDQNMQVIATNAGAEEWLGMQAGELIDNVTMLPEPRAALKTALRKAISADETFRHVLSVDNESQNSPALFQIRHLVGMEGCEGPAALVVTSQRYWSEGQNAALREAFGLTSAEGDVVGALLRGHTIKTIAELRGISEGTVRGQLKKIFLKMNVNSQSEIIRLALPMTDVSVLSVADTLASPGIASGSEDWLEKEVWRPFRTLRTPDGRKLDYHVMGPADGAPILYSHMGYCQARWSRSMIALAFKLGLKIICPIRAGFGYSENLHPKADVLKATRDDTLLVLQTVGISRLPYIAHGNDLIFAADLVSERPDLISEVIGICARPCLPGDGQLLGTGSWQRYFMSTAKYAPKLVHFGAKAGVAMGKRIGLEAMYKQVCKNSPTDLAMLDIDEMRAVLLANNSLVVGKDTDVSQAFAMEYIAMETDWSAKLIATRETPIQILLGEEDPTVDPASVPQIRAAYPWIDVKVVPGTGQTLLFQKYRDLIPIFAQAARRCAASSILT